MKPKISCLCVTNKRVAALKNAIDYFTQQRYPNKELIIVYKDDDQDTKAYLATIQEGNIRPIELNSQLNYTLGDMRNVSIDAASGEYVCIWDDDDWYHRNRLSIQLSTMLNHRKESIVMMTFLIYDSVGHQAYLGQLRTWEPTLFCEKAALKKKKISYPPLPKGEDMPFMSDLLNNNLVFPLIHPQLYIYTYTGRNLNDAAHFEMMFKGSQKLSDYHTREVGKIVRREYSVNESSDILDSYEFLEPLNYFNLNYSNG